MLANSSCTSDLRILESLYIYKTKPILNNQLGSYITDDNQLLTDDNQLLTDDNQKIFTFHSIYDYFALLKAFNTNTLNFHQYFGQIIFSSTIAYAQHQTENK